MMKLTACGGSSYLGTALRNRYTER